MELIHCIYIIIALISGIILQVGLTKRRKIIEKEKRKRINILKDMSDSKIIAIGNYEEKAKNKFIK